MKLWIPMLILFISVCGICLWASLYSYKILNTDHLSVMCCKYLLLLGPLLSLYDVFCLT